MPGSGVCGCWFRTLGGDQLRETQLPASTLVPDADLDALDAAKLNVRDLYQPLKRWQTRVVTILPATSNEPLCCELWTAGLIHGPGVAVSGTPDIVTYSALSYSWGQGEPTKIITCNGVAVPVNGSLTSALLDLRKEREPVRIWCDALCINQADPVEKAQQVRNMLQIFEKADLVIAWIGRADDWTKTLYRALNDESDDGSRHPKQSPHASIKYYLKDGDRQHDPECLENVSKIVRVADDYLKRPWFRRTWVRQEVFGTSNLILYCGGQTIGLRDFLTATRQISAFEQWLLSNPLQAGLASRPDRRQVNETERQRLLVPASVSILANSYQHAGTDHHDYKPPGQRLRYSAHWLQVLNEGVNFEETDPRDKVYGVLGIITSPRTKFYVECRPDIQHAEFPISYTKSVSEVYQDVVKYLINFDRNLDALQIFESRRNRAKDLPSWVTDWRQCNERSIVHCAPDDKPERERIGEAPIQDLNDYGKLRLEGVQVGTPLEAITARSKRDQRTEISPNPECMDTNYVEMIESDCFVSGKCTKLGDSWPRRPSVLKTSTERERLELLVPREARLDDIVVALLGGSCLFLLRPRAQNEYKFLGPVVRTGGDRLPDWSRARLQSYVLV
jgi:Heterokaryon incompatibility protein (HET)